MGPISILVLFSLYASVVMVQMNPPETQAQLPSSGIKNSTTHKDLCRKIDIFTLHAHTASKDSASAIKTDKEQEIELKKQEIVKSLENCDFTSLYKIEDTVAAFDNFKDIILRCIGRQKLLRSEKDSKKGVIENYCNTEHHENPRFSLLCSNDSTPIQSLNNVNIFFSTLGERLSTKILEQLDTTEINLANEINTGSYTSKLVLTPTNKDEILQIITTLARHKSTSSLSHDYLDHDIVKKAKHVLASPITYICNLSLSSGVVPDSIKMAIVIPFFKSGDPKDPSNYRPVSLLTFISKILEKVVNKRLISYLETNNILSEHQFGYRKGQTIKKLLTQMADHITTKLDSEQKCIGIFLDLLKAFDTVSRPIMFKKLEALGVRELALDWFKSYFENRKQRIAIGNRVSNPAVVNFGVPQGSALGPVLFLIYFNDLLQLNMTQTKPYAYADDTVFIIHGNTWKTVMDISQTNLDKVHKWLQNNLMSFNVSKTKFLAFSYSELTAPNIPILIKVHNCTSEETRPCKKNAELKQVHSTKYLGAILDDNLAWSQFKGKNQIQNGN